MGKKRKKKSELIKRLEYAAAYSVLITSHLLPLTVVRRISNFFGDLVYTLVSRRRNIAIENLRHAFKGEKTEEELRRIARQSCREALFTFLEIIKLRTLVAKPNAFDRFRSKTANLDKLFNKAKKIHDESKGCIFVTPHIGNWEVLPHVCSIVGIPLAVVARPLDNAYLEKLVYANRTSSGQVIIPKKNALFVLQRTLRKGISIGMLPDQSTMKGISIDFFGRKATTTPAPAMLAIMYKRPIVVVACCRKSGNYNYEGFVCDPIWPGEYTSEKAEIFRLTEEIHRNMESIIKKYPEQYLWMHNRWKTYKGKKSIFRNL